MLRNDVLLCNNSRTFVKEAKEKENKSGEEGEKFPGLKMVEMNR